MVGVGADQCALRLGQADGTSGFPYRPHSLFLSMCSQGYQPVPHSLLPGALGLLPSFQPAKGVGLRQHLGPGTNCTWWPHNRAP